MIPVYQTKFGEEGNCLSACLASILEKNIEELPEIPINCKSNWYINFTKDLYFNFNIYLMPILIDNSNQFLIKDKIIIAVGEAIENNNYHAVLYKNGELLHDPFPNGKGLKKIDYFLIPVKYFNQNI